MSAPPSVARKLAPMRHLRLPDSGPKPTFEGPMSTAVSDLKPVYLIYGTEELKLQQALQRLKAMVGEVADLDFNSETFEGDSVSADTVVAACNTLPFASERRLVIVRSVDKLAKDGLDALASYASNPSPTTILVLVAEKMAKNTKLYKAVDKLGGAAEYRAPRKQDYPAEVQRLFAARGRRIDGDAAALLVSAVGYDLRRLSVEVEKAVAFVGERVEVTTIDIEQVAATTATTSIFEYTEALGDRDCRRALARAASLLGEGETIFALHAMGLRTIRDLIMVRALIDRGQGSVGDVMSAVGRPDWQVKRLIRQAKGYSAAELVDGLRLAAEGERQMKTSRDARLVLERWIVKVCS